MIKKINFLILVFFLGISLNSFSSEKQSFTKIDTLKKTDQFILFNKTANIGDIFFSKNKKSTEPILYFKIGYTADQTNSNAIKTAVQGGQQYGETNQPRITDVKILMGKYSEMRAETASKTASLYTLTEIEFPLHLQVKILNETVEFELLQPGKWTIDLNLKK
ncbi:hypothetical protein [Pedobacter jejuensis]|uniref:Uncharacterized protein n=1 Tax=Pedobacter jejuensis TaxID=1268550 RepID=A0A3N0C1B4_9SPHI|nr:hypothetical protein [Pedobacter jejuensis]RNL55522.1 hypothetical protein D7004_04220 [Pedobacter jejuensis]